MDEIVPRAKEIPPATPPGDLYSVQHQDTRRAEPCRLKRPPPEYEGRWKLFRRAAFFAGLMLFVLLVLMAVLKLTTRTRRTSSSRRVGTPPALHEAEERKNSLPGEGPWVSAAAPDPQMMIQAVQALREADALAVIGGWSEAAAAYRRVLDLWPGYAAADAGLGHALLMQGEWALAGQHLQRAAAADPGRAPVLNDLGRIELIRKNPDGAAIFFGTAAELDPEHVESHLNLARADYVMGYVDRARKHIHDALEMHPGHPEALRYLAYLEAAAGNYETAMSLLAGAIQHAPDMPSLYTDAAATCALMGNTSKAVDYLRSASERIPPEQVRLIFGEPVFMAARKTSEGQQLEADLVTAVQLKKEAGNQALEDAHSAQQKTEESAEQE